MVRLLQQPLKEHFRDPFFSSCSLSLLKKMRSCGPGSIYLECSENILRVKLHTRPIFFYIHSISKALIGNLVGLAFRRFSGANFCGIWSARQSQSKLPQASWQVLDIWRLAPSRASPSRERTVMAATVQKLQAEKEAK
jgi:hypothetical protein